MKLFNFGKRKLDVDELSTPRETRHQHVREEAWKVFRKYDDELGFDSRSDKSLGLAVTESRRHPDHYSVKLYKGKEVIGEMLVDKHSGDYQLRDENKHSLAQTKEFGQDHSKEHSRKEPVKEKKHEGEYKLVRNCKHMGERHGKSYESGTIDVVDPKGKVVFSGEYHAGGFGNGRPPFTAHAELATPEIKNTTLIGGKVTVPALRISNSSMPGRSGILIHDGLNMDGTHGCICFTTKGDMGKFSNIWNSIPREDRPRTLDAVATPQVIAQMHDVKSLVKGDMKISEASSHQNLPHAHSAKQRQI